MNVKAQMSGQISGQVPSQAGPQLSGLSQQNGSSLPPQMQNLGNIGTMDPDLLAARKLMLEKITQIFRHKCPSSTTEWLQRLPDLVRRVEEFLYKNAASKEDYVNMDTFDTRLHAAIRGLPHHNQPLAHHISSSSPNSTMIPTPGMPRSNYSNSTMPCAVDNPMVNTNGSGTVALTSVNMGNVLPISNGTAGIGHGSSFSASDGTLSNGYQQSPANMSIGSGGNNIMSSMGAPCLPSQMIPTPGFNNPQFMSMNSECTVGGGFSGVESTMVAHQQQQKQYVGNQNSRILHGLGARMGVRLRSNMQQKPSPYGISNGLAGGGRALTGKDMQLVNGPTTSEGYMTMPPYGSSLKPMQQHLDQQHHQPILTTSSSQQMIPTAGDGYRMNSSDLPASGSLYGSANSVGSIMSSQNMSSNLQSKSKLNYAEQTQQPNLQSLHQSSHIKPSPFDHSQKMNFQSTHSTLEHLQSQQQFQQRSSQPYGQFVKHQHQQPQKQQNQQFLLKSDLLRQSSLTSSFGAQNMTEQGMGTYSEPLLPQAPEQFHLPELLSQYQQNTAAEDHCEDTQSIGHFSGPQDFHTSFSQGSQQIHHIMHQHQQIAESQNEFSSLSTGSQPEVLLQGQWHPQPPQKSHLPDQSSFEQHIQEGFQQRITGENEAQQPHFLLEGSLSGHTAAAASSIMVPPSACRVSCSPGNLLRGRQFLDQQRWLLFLLHARCCSAPKGKCPAVECITAQQLVVHMGSCNDGQCGYPRCQQSKGLFKHYHNCRAGGCPVCIPVHARIERHKACSRPLPNNDAVNLTSGSWKSVNALDAGGLIPTASALAIQMSDDLQSSTKRMKVEHPSSLVPNSESSQVSSSLINQSLASQEAQPQGHRQVIMSSPSKFELAEVKTESLTISGFENSPNFSHVKVDNSKDVYGMKPDVGSVVPNEQDDHANQESMQICGEIDQAALEVKQEANAAPAETVAGTKSGKPKIKGVSLTELFTPEQIREHIIGLRQWVGQSKAKAEKNQAMEHSMSENSCQLCAVEKLTFEPPPIYCSPCGARIKRNAMYYTIGTGDTRHYFCIPCYNEARGDSIEVEGAAYPKAKLEKKKNDEETEEWWVQCDKCEAWQHQICALFNGRRNDGGQAEYTCPNCYVQEVERGERMPLPQSAVLGAKDLPRTLLSDHIEQRLFRRLKQERQERARHLGKNIDEVPGADALVVRVVSSVDKKLEVKQRFLEIFQEENYPTEYPYKSKVILLFQKIEGVEVCLFGMYVQEFGSECQFPNQRRVYLSYLDSVKYFRPETRTVTGEALRTFVYHEILIGYLEYCKKRGFTSCYIWACPPLKGEDYILYCHPEIQKTPKSDKLREWYLAMLRKAAKENIVDDLTNLYDHFFVPMGECKAKVTAARLPYFDGDYWPGAAEDMINQLQQEEDGRKQQKKGKTKKTLTKRALKAAGQSDLSGNVSKDALLMQKLGETISPMKEDFIMVHLQHSCTHCCMLMASGTRWVCNQCKKFQLCDKCHDAEQKLEERDRHPINGREKHVLSPVEINDVPLDTKDKDEILESEFFDTRQAFLSLCQGNHYQYDTLRRAKHSSMMVLYHLHNPTAPAFVTTCNACHHDIETGQGWRCETCPDFDVCNGCYQRDGGVDHPHRLTNHPSIADRDAQNKEARQKRVLQLRKMLDLLVHASQCRNPHCQYPNCRKVKGLFRHGINCRVRASGGCPLCKKMWYLLQLHARACKESECHVPRCRDLKEHLRRLQQQSDSRRRAAVMEMMRQRAAEVAGNT